jgi:hypothetical protein
MPYAFEPMPPSGRRSFSVFSSSAVGGGTSPSRTLPDAAGVGGCAPPMPSIATPLEASRASW